MTDAEKQKLRQLKAENSYLRACLLNASEHAKHYAYIMDAAKGFRDIQALCEYKKEKP